MHYESHDNMSQYDEIYKNDMPQYAAWNQSQIIREWNEYDDEQPYNIKKGTFEVHCDSLHRLYDKYLILYYIALSNNKVSVLDDLIIFDRIPEKDSYDKIESIKLYDDRIYPKQVDYLMTYILANISDRNIIPDNVYAYYFEEYILVKFKSNSIDECETILQNIPCIKTLSVYIYLKN